MGKYSILKDIEEALERYPNLKKEERKKNFWLEGTVDIEDDQEGVLDSFKVKFEFPKGYPYRYPKVTELGEKIERSDGWHCYENGSLCIAVKPIEIIQCRRGITLSWFIQDKLIPHLALQSYRIKYGDYPINGYAHREKGLKEAYLKICTTDNWKFAVKAIELVINNEKIGRNQPCFCDKKNKGGKPIKFKQCHEKHEELIKTLKIIGPKYLREDLESIKNPQQKKK